MLKSNQSILQSETWLPKMLIAGSHSSRYIFTFKYCIPL